MKRAEETIRDFIGTMVTFLVLALLLFHSPYSKAQTPDERVGVVRAYGRMLLSPVLNNPTRSHYAHQLLENTVPKNYPKAVTPLLTEGVVQIRRILDANVPEAHEELIPKLVSYVEKGVQFGGAVNSQISGILENTTSSSLIDSCVRYLRAVVTTADHNKHVAETLQNYQESGGRWVRSPKTCAPSMSGGSARAINPGLGIAASPVL